VDQTSAVASVSCGARASAPMSTVTMSGAWLTRPVPVTLRLDQRSTAAPMNDWLESKHRHQRLAAIHFRPRDDLLAVPAPVDNLHGAH